MNYASFEEGQKGFGIVDFKSSFAVYYNGTIVVYCETEEEAHEFIKKELEGK